MSQSVNIQQAYQLAEQHYQAGRLRQAEQVCRQILAVKPDNPETNRLLGVIVCRGGQNDPGIQLIRQAIKFAPNYAMAHLSLGNALIAKGSLDEAIESFETALAIEPNMFGAYLNLGTVYSYKHLHDEAIACYRKSIALQPDFALTHNNLGNALKDKGQINEAIESYKKALSIAPNLHEAHSNLGNALLEQGKTTEAIASFKKALSISPKLYEAHGNLANALKDAGKISEAIRSYRQALKIKPDSEGIHSNLIYALLSNPTVSGEDIYREARKWEEQHAKPIYAMQQPHDNSQDKNSRLRIGYVSPDFRSHPINFFFEPVLKSHNREKFEIYLYSNVINPDLVTRRLKTEVDHWREIVGSSDADVAKKIREDRIDILVDLAKHTAHNRLLVFAYKPAPIQVTWMGYPDTTGLQAIDYRFVDELVCPKGKADKLNSEELIRLPQGYFCFEPRADAPDVVDIPFKNKGHITFGSFNNFHKINKEVIGLWSEIFHQVPGSHLLLIGNAFEEVSAKKHFLDIFAVHGVEPERIKMIPKVPINDYLALYGKVDITLDPFPYNGHTTTCDSLWMGVPVITLLGKVSSCRVGGSILTRIGFQDLIAENKREYVNKAVLLAKDPGRLSALRVGMRDRVLASPLCDVKGITKSLEDAYLKMWERYISK